MVMLTTILLLAAGTCMTSKVLRKNEEFVRQALVAAEHEEQTRQEEIPQFDGVDVDEYVTIDEVEYHEEEVLV
jgi:hypothetical protein